MNKQAFEKIAEGHRLIQEGYLLLANDNPTETKAPSKTEKKVDKPTEQSKEEIAVVTVADVRAVMATKTQNGKTPQVKALLKSFGVEKLSSVPEDRLAELLKQVEVI